MFEKEELKPIDTSKYNITETGQVLKRTKEELEREYYGRRPTEPYSEDDSPNDLANIVQYTEENLSKAFKAIAELEKEKCKLLCIIQGKDKVIQELKKENAELTCQMKRNTFCYSCKNATERCYRNEIGCPCEKYKSYKDENAELKNKLEVLIAVGNTCTKGLNKQLTKAKELIKEMLSILPKENIEGIYEITEEAEQFISG